MSDTPHTPAPLAHLFWEVRTSTTAPPANPAVPNVNRLHTRLLALRKRYGNAFLPGAQTAEQMLERFATLLFPAGRVSDYLVSNITVNADPFLLIRPQVLLPSHAQDWPAGVTLGVKGFVERRSALFRMTDISDMADLPARPWERPLRALSVRGYPRHGEAVVPALTPEWLNTLPLISQQTAEALKEWTDYLDWKQKLVQANIAGIRYLSRSLQDDGVWRFVIAVPPGANATSLARLLRSDDLCAYSLDYSTDPWQFTYRENTKARPQALGDAVPGKQVTLPRSALPDTPTRDDLPEVEFREVSYRLADPALEQFLTLMEGEGQAAAIKQLETTLPATGFLAVSAIGDLALIRRQREELQRLQKESGFAPFVSAYLFDIGQARVPQAWHEIEPDAWLRKDMNPDQRKAVQMMISTPDLSLIQGPPGTGKTTMIAEAVYQLVRQGKKVLVASQANLAVDNALERLGNTPAIRALRLGAKADKASAFIPEQALASYYRSVAGACQQQHLEPWNAMQTHARDLDEWISTTELIAADLRQAEERLAMGRALRERSAQQQQEVQRQLDDLLSAHSQLGAAQAFVDGLAAGQADWSDTLPDHVRQAWHTALRERQSALMAAGLDAGRPLDWYDPGAGARQSRALFAVAAACQGLLERLPMLRNEWQRLSRLQSEQLVSEDTEVLIASLTAEKARLWRLVEDGDEAALSGVKEVAQQLKHLAREGGLSRELYETVFDEASAKALLSAEATRTSVVTALAGALRALRRAQAWRRRAHALARTQLSSAAGALADPAQLRATLAQVTHGIRELDHQLVDDGQQRARHVSNLAAQLDGAALAADWPARCDAALAAKRAQRDAVLAGLRQTESLRKDWTPVLRDWVATLQQQGQAERGEAPMVRYLSDTFIESCNVVGITCSERRTTLLDAKHDFFDVAIVDEVSKATPPELLMCISMARTAILVGDHRQLPPVFKEGISAEQYLEQVEDQDDASAPDASLDTALTRENLDRFSDMVSASLFKRHFEEAPAALKAFLLTQYRMHPQIMNVVNAFYEGRLRCGLTDPDGLQADTPARDIRQHGVRLHGPDGIAYLETDQHVLWIDSGKTPNGQEAFERHAGASGKVNDTEAAVIAKVLADLDDAYTRQGHGPARKPPKQVGIVTFYARQIRVIREAIASLVAQRGPFVGIKVDVNTADRYQGQERPIIIVSLVRCPPHKLSARANTAQFERINVAFSRAQELLVVLGAERVFRPYEIQLPHLDRPGRMRRAVYGHIIGEIELNGGLKAARQVLDQAMFDRLLPASAAPPAPTARRDEARKGRKPKHAQPGGAR